MSPRRCLRLPRRCRAAIAYVIYVFFFFLPRQLSCRAMFILIFSTCSGRHMGRHSSAMPSPMPSPRHAARLVDTLVAVGEVNGAMPLPLLRQRAATR